MWPTSLIWLHPLQFEDTLRQMLYKYRQISLKRARQAARAERWSEAERHYRRYLDQFPADSATWTQLGHSLKEQGNLQAAVAAYRHAVEAGPDLEEGWVHLAHSEHRLGDREASVKTLEQGLANNPNAARLISEILAMGERDRLPLPVQAAIESSEGCYSLARYPIYRAARAHCMPPTVRSNSLNVLPVVDARGVAADLTAVTLNSLDHADALILTEDAGPMVGRPVLQMDQIAGLPSSTTHLLLIEAGCRLEAGAAGRLSEAMSQTGAPAAYCDHDHWTVTETGLAFSEPCFQPMFDSFWFKRTEVWPPCMLIATVAIEDTMRWGELFSMRMNLPLTYAHVPMVLASRPVEAPPLTLPSVASGDMNSEEGIQVIIQTRDAPAMLAQCVSTLRSTAARPDLLDIVIIDNQSALPETSSLLESWSAQGIARSMHHDEPFNWARANNLAVPRGRAPYLLFLNNDVEMESAGWDNSLRDYFAQEQVGVIGSLLLYPNRLIQHAGVIFGMDNGGPVHEGVGRQFDQPGPAGRWRHARLAAAVTGAWLAAPRALFETVGGFEEALPVAFNDIDFCLRCRKAGHLIVQASDIIAIHRESATRGTTLSPEELAREQTEWAWLQARWGKALEIDPAYNPQWVHTGQPFDGIRAPSDAALARWIKASARPQPWSIS